MKIFLTFFLITGFCFAEDAQKPLPKDVQTIVDTREKALTDARVAFDKAVIKANEDAVQKMESVVKTNTQKGDLDGALASRKFIEDWNKEKEVAKVGVALGGCGPKKDKFNPVGRWSGTGADSSRIFIFTENGKWTSSWPDFGGTWKVEGEMLIITSTLGNNQTFTVPAVKEGDWPLNGGSYNIHVLKK